MKVAKNAKDCHRQSKGKDSHKSGRNTLLRIVSDVSVHVVVSSEIVNISLPIKIMYNVASILYSSFPS